MDIFEIMNARRSMRKYEGGSISDSELEQMVRSAMMAPSWKNSQSPRYYCVRSESGMAELTRCLSPHNARNSVGALALIVTSYVRGLAGFEPNGTPSNELMDGWGLYDNGLASQNLLLAAKAMGYDSLVMGLRDEAAIRGLLCVPENETIVAVIAIGKGAKTPIMPPRKPVEEVMKLL